MAFLNVPSKKHNPQKKQMSGSKHIKSMQRRTSFFSHHPRVSGSCCANSWDRFTAQKMRYPLPPSVRNTKKLARNLRNLIKWTFSSTWAAFSSVIASCIHANKQTNKQKPKIEYLSYILKVSKPQKLFLQSSECEE